MLVPINNRAIKISIHAPRTGSDVIVTVLAAGHIISIHAPRTGSDVPLASALSTKIISIHAPRTGSDVRARDAPRRAINISIHAPRTGSDACWKPTESATRISIHAPRTGSDVPFHLIQQHHQFQSTLPARGATSSILSAITVTLHFNPRSPHGERQNSG